VVEAPDLEALFRDEADGVYRTLLAFTGGRAAIAEDATAEAFARAFARRNELHDPLAWIYRVAFRLALDEMRRDGRRGDPVDEALELEELDEVMSALHQLSPNQRAAVVLRHVVGLDTGEIAERMGIARPTVRVHLFRARQRLRVLLGSEEVEA
jgi:RNA polymerase sigma-70 factor (ECF subfamily)